MDLRRPLHRDEILEVHCPHSPLYSVFLRKPLELFEPMWNAINIINSVKTSGGHFVGRFSFIGCSCRAESSPRGERKGGLNGRLSNSFKRDGSLAIRASPLDGAIVQKTSSENSAREAINPCQLASDARRLIMRTFPLSSAPVAVNALLSPTRRVTLYGHGSDYLGLRYCRRTIKLFPETTVNSLFRHYVRPTLGNKVVS